MPYFGFESVSWKEKDHRIRNLFDSVAPRYDLMNDLMSGGLHRCWKRTMVLSLGMQAGDCVVDVAGGTGDIAFLIHQIFPHLGLTVMVCDPTLGMIQKGRERSFNRAQVAGLQWICGRAESLPFAESQVAACTLSFGLRNVGDLSHTFQESKRILKPGGSFVALEFSPLSDQGLSGIISPLYRKYCALVLPFLGRFLAKDQQAYDYLAQSIQQFPPPEVIRKHMTNAGFEQVTSRPLGGGICHLYSGTKSSDPSF